ncbi:hypothetical protein ACOKM5_35935 [Streptomyces sp. BH097]|uniref:DinB/UmuC family translesion DNA polymerase n=1 Tax=unclassified Streptomyces TaxID=2593676 RepID=UPI003BB6C5F6
MRSLSSRHRFSCDELDPTVHRAALHGLGDEIGARLRVTGEMCRGLSLTVRYAHPSPHQPLPNFLGRTKP